MHWRGRSRGNGGGIDLESEMSNLKFEIDLESEMSNLKFEIGLTAPGHSLC
jgi:hypothetical protein